MAYWSPQKQFVETLQKGSSQILGKIMKGNYMYV